MKRDFTFVADLVEAMARLLPTTRLEPGDYEGLELFLGYARKLAKAVALPNPI